MFWILILRNVSVCSLSYTFFISSPPNSLHAHTHNLEILVQRVKKLEPEDIALKIEQFDKDLCSEEFLREIKNLLPTPEQVRFLYGSEYFMDSDMLPDRKAKHLSYCR